MNLTETFNGKWQNFVDDGCRTAGLDGEMDDGMRESINLELEQRGIVALSERVGWSEKTEFSFYLPNPLDPQTSFHVTAHLCCEPVPDEHTSIVDEHPFVSDEHTSVLDEYTPIVNERPFVSDEHTSVLDEHTPIVNERPFVSDEHTSVLDEHTPIVNERPFVPNAITPNPDPEPEPTPKPIPDPSCMPCHVAIVKVASFDLG